MTDNTQDIDYWLTKLRERRWSMHFLGDPGDARELGATLIWPQVWDVVILVDEHLALAYRTPRADGADPFAPEFIVDSYAGPATWTLRWVLTLPPPGDEVPPLRPAPADFRIPTRQRRPPSILTLR